MLPALLLLAACTPGPKDTTETGEAPTPEAPWPDWAFQHWVWEDEGTSESALALVDGYLERDIPVGAVIIDSPWETGYNTFEWDPDLYPDPQGLVDAFHARGVRVFVWIVPAINTDVEDLWQHAADRGWFMQDDADSGPAVVDWWKGEGSLLDYFNPDAVAWWHELMAPVLGLGIDGWKCDGLDYAALLAPYSPAAGRRVERIEYSYAYYRDFFDHTREVLGDDRIITARPVDNYGAGIGGEVVAFAPVDMNWAGWVGDQDPDFGGLRNALDNMYWSADLGYVAFGSDIGGYRDDGSDLGRDRETFVRWAQLGAFNPVMENGGGGEHRPWMFDDEVLRIYRAFVELHHALLPYLHEEGARAFAEGRSLVTFVDRETYAFHLGPDIYVQPVLEPGTSVSLAVPEGTWRWLFGDLSITGPDDLTLETPLDAFPAFVREGSEAESLLLGE